MSGKTTVARLFSRLGAKVIDADRIAHQLMGPKGELWRRIVEAFGKEVLGKGGLIDRERLGRIVFSSSRNLERLNCVCHPPIIEAIKRRIRELSEDVIIIDAPLLLESGLHSIVDILIVVKIDGRTQLQRLRSRGLSREEAEARISSQLPLKEKLRVADYVIQTDGTLKETRSQVERIWEEIHPVRSPRQRRITSNGVNKRGDGDGYR